MTYTYRSPADLRWLGEKVRDKIIDVTMNQGDEYGYAQVRVNNYPSQLTQHMRPALPGYSPVTNGAQDAHENLEGYSGP